MRFPQTTAFFRSDSGVSLVRQIVIAHGWNIDPGEAPGGGAKFSIFAS